MRWWSEVTPVAGPCCARPAIVRCRVEMGSDLGLSALVPLRRAAIRRPLPSTGSRGSVPPLHRSDGALRLPAARPAALRSASRDRTAVRSSVRSHRRPARPPRAWGFVDRCPVRSPGGRRQGLPGSWGTPLCPRPALRPRWDLHARPSRRVGAASRYFDGVGSHDTAPFGAQSHGLRTRCRRFASPGYPGRRKTRFRLLASVAGRDWLPAGFHAGFQSSLHLIPPAQVSPGAPKCKPSRWRGWRGAWTRANGSEPRS